MMRSRPGKRSIIQRVGFFERQTNQVKEREDSIKLINLEIEKERLPQISMKYRGSFVFAFSVMFSLFRIFFLEAVMNGFLGFFSLWNFG